MAIQLSTAVRNARLQVVLDQAVGTSPPSKCRIKTGSPPADFTTDPGTLLAEISMPSPAWNTPSGGAMTKTGTWVDTSANNSGTAGWFRIIDTSLAGIMQGTVGTSGTDMIVDSTTFVAGQAFSILTFTITASNA
jgi:hypothetical protein